MKQALKFTSRVLKDVACPELEGKIVELVEKQLSSTERESLPSGAAQSWDHGAAVRVRSAYCLTEPQRDVLITILKNKLRTEAPIEFAVDQTLVAGLEIMIGSYVLRANLRDELEYFSAMRNYE